MVAQSTIGIVWFGTGRKMAPAARRFLLALVLLGANGTVLVLPQTGQHFRELLKTQMDYYLHPNVLLFSPICGFVKQFSLALMVKRYE